MWKTFYVESARSPENIRKFVKYILNKNYYLFKKEPIFAVLFKN